jgi:hypothetical protein
MDEINNLNHLNKLGLRHLGVKMILVDEIFKIAGCKSNLRFCINGTLWEVLGTLGLKIIYHQFRGDSLYIYFLHTSRILISTP